MTSTIFTLTIIIVYQFIDINLFTIDLPKDSYFEQQLSDRTKEFKERKNNKERINFRPVNMYYRLPLSEIDSVSPDLIKNQIVLVGFLRDSLITPMNQWYGRYSDIQGDMSDAQISANIISTINKREFINEVNPFFRVVIILFVSLLNTVLLRLLRTRRDMLNILLGVILFVILNGLSTVLIVLAFAQNYYLSLDEMTVVLFISAIVSIYWNTRDNKAPAHNSVFMPLENFTLPDRKQDF